MDDELERRLRDGLARRAADADVRAPLVERARADARHRRRARAGAVGLAAAALVAVVAVVVSPDDAPPVAGPRAMDVPTDWRTEVWHGLSVRVPPDWGYGGAPGAGPFGDATACFPAAIVDPRGQQARTRVDDGRGYVGRPIALTDECADASAGGSTEAPYVWLGTTTEVGVVELDDGFVQETREVAGTTLTVGSDDADLREAIWSTAGPVDLCLAELVERPSAASGVGSAESSWVCAYEGDGSTWRLVFGAGLEEGAVAELVSRYASAPPFNPGLASCVTGEVWHDHVIVVSAGGDEYVAGEQDNCPVVQGPDGYRGLTDELLDPVTANGVRAVLPYFIGPRG